MANSEDKEKKFMDPYGYVTEKSGNPTATEAKLNGQNFDPAERHPSKDTADGNINKKDHVEDGLEFLE